jgi:hypothetical protein
MEFVFEFQVTIHKISIDMSFNYCHQTFFTSLCSLRIDCFGNEEVESFFLFGGSSSFIVFFFYHVYDDL